MSSRLITLGSWMGGDRDGNPYVTHDITKRIVFPRHPTLDITRSNCQSNPGRGVPRRYFTSWNLHFRRVLPLKFERLTFEIALSLIWGSLAPSLSSELGTNKTVTARFGTNKTVKARFGTNETAEARFSTNKTVKARFGTNKTFKAGFGTKKTVKARFGTNKRVKARFGTNKTVKTRGRGGVRWPAWTALQSHSSYGIIGIVDMET